MGYQQMTLVGNVGNDPEMKYTPGGDAVTEFSVAYSYKKGNGEEVTTWFRCSAWRQSAEAVSNYVHKGDEVMVVGRIGARAYTDRNSGEPRASLDMTVDRVVLLRNGQRGQGAHQSAAPPPYGGQQAAQSFKPAPDAAAPVDASTLPAAPVPVGYDAPLSPDDLPF